MLTISRHHASAPFHMIYCSPRQCHLGAHTTIGRVEYCYDLDSSTHSLIATAHFGLMTGLRAQTHRKAPTRPAPTSRRAWSGKAVIMPPSPASLVLLAADPVAPTSEPVAVADAAAVAVAPVAPQYSELSAKLPLLEEGYVSPQMELWQLCKRRT